MMVLITYDVNTEDSGGRKRLRQIAKQCVNYGQRVQNSVFECLVDAAQCKQLQHKLLAIMDEEKDSLRFYYLGNKYETRIEHFGAKAGLRRKGGLRSGGRAHHLMRTGSVPVFPGRFAPRKVGNSSCFPFAQHAATPLFVRLCRNFVAFAQICREYFGNFAVAPRKGCVD